MKYSSLLLLWTHSAIARYPLEYTGVEETSLLGDVGFLEVVPPAVSFPDTVSDKIKHVDDASTQDWNLIDAVMNVAINDRGCPNKPQRLSEGAYRIPLTTKANCLIGPDLNDLPDTGIHSLRDARDVTLKYRLFVPRDFKTNEGIKLPGLAGTVGQHKIAYHCTGTSSNPCEDAFSARLQWHSEEYNQPWD